MKRAVISIFLTFLLIVFLSFVFAQEIENPEGEEASGIMPDSVFWGLDRAMEQVGMAFAVGEKGNALKALEHARERRLEAQTMAEKGKTEEAEKAMNKWEEKIQRAVRERNELEEENETEEAEEVDEEISNAIVVLERVINKIQNDDNPNNDNALQGLNRALENVRGRGDLPARVENKVKEKKTQQGLDNGEDDEDDEIPAGQGQGNKPDNFELAVSDAPADIGDFSSLVVYFEKARVFRAGSEDEDEEEDEEDSNGEGNSTEMNMTNLALNEKNSTGTGNETAGNETIIPDQNQTQNQTQERDGEHRGWFILELDDDSTDLTKVVGGNADSILKDYLPEGKYTKVELYVSKVEAVLAGSNKTVDVKVPSGKLMITRNFEISGNESVQFVFDINVVKRGKSGSYNLLPVISKSGVVGEDVEAEVEEEPEENDDEIIGDIGNGDGDNNSTDMNQTEINSSS